MKAWDVYLDEKLIDTVFYDGDCSAEYVWEGCVNHDGYDPGIHVWCNDNGETFPLE